MLKTSGYRPMPSFSEQDGPKAYFCLSGPILLEEDALHLGVNSKSINAKDGLYYFSGSEINSERGLE